MVGCVCMWQVGARLPVCVWMACREREPMRPAAVCFLDFCDFCDFSHFLRSRVCLILPSACNILQPLAANYWQLCWQCRKNKLCKISTFQWFCAVVVAIVVVALALVISYLFACGLECAQLEQSLFRQQIVNCDDYFAMIKHSKRTPLHIAGISIHIYIHTYMLTYICYEFVCQLSRHCIRPGIFR